MPFYSPVAVRGGGGLDGVRAQAEQVPHGLDLGGTKEMISPLESTCMPSIWLMRATPTAPKR